MGVSQPKYSNRPESSNVDAAYSYDKVSWVYIAPVAGIHKSTIMNAATAKTTPARCRTYFTSRSNLCPL